MEWLLGLVNQYPWVANTLMIIGSLRLVLKPVFSILRTYVDTTSATADNEWLDKVENNSVVKAIFYALDWIASIKIKP